MTHEQRTRWAGLIARAARLPQNEQQVMIRAMTLPQRHVLASHWGVWALPAQRTPPRDWRVWLIRAGRGFGKTRAGAEWVSAIARDTPDARIALVGGTREDVHNVMVEGKSGLIAVARAGEYYRWRRDRGEFAFASGAKAYVYSAEAPEKLRGPEHHAAWCDELAKWRHGDATWDNLTLSVRLGDFPRVLVTTTPRAVQLMRRVMALPGFVETRGGTRDNPHLPESFVASMTDLYAGTRLGRQELDGELVEDVEDALWTRDAIEARRAETMPARVRVVVGVDPPAGTASGRGGDACGIVALAKGENGFAYVLEDASVVGASPEGWARAVAACAARHKADRVVAEANQGGDMVRSVLLAADCMLPVRLVRATHGKTVRAEPVAALYEAGKAWHLGAFPTLEDEMCGLVTGGGYEGPGRSPDRADALVWAMTELMLRRPRAAEMRVL